MDGEKYQRRFETDSDYLQILDQIYNKFLVGLINDIIKKADISYIVKHWDELNDEIKKSFSDMGSTIKRSKKTGLWDLKK
jgi:hypothetical protein